MAMNAEGRSHSYRITDENTGEPVCQPYKTIEELEEWSPGKDDTCRATVPLQGTDTQSLGQPEHPRTIVCHDMAGGYLDDRFLQGVVEKDAYRFYHWSAIDQFIYFSHYFVTIPPPGWTNIAHKHGVPMLGTIITEWDDGKQRCEKLLSSPEKYIQIAQTLAQMAIYYNFDGWLVNIENPIAPEKVPSLVDFVKVLTEEMHRVRPYSIVLWYDSVIQTGELKWQNELNSDNKCFFEVCDGIFINYTWKDGNLERSLQCAGECDRSVFDVYIGVDIFGRGCRGGGGFNTKEALEVIREHYLSAAIFAQGWTWEKFEKDHFSAHENRFWALIDPYMNHHPLKSLPIGSDFSQGWGRKFYQDGEVIFHEMWGNIGIQSTQPTWQPVDRVDDTDRSSDDTLKRCLPYHYHLSDSFNGGGCLRMLRSGQYILFKCQVPLPDDLTVSFTVKCDGSSSIDFILVTEDGKPSSDIEAAVTNVVLGENLEHNSEHKNGWIKRTYNLHDLGGKVLKSVEVKVVIDNQRPLLGECQIMQAQDAAVNDLTRAAVTASGSPGESESTGEEGAVTWTLLWGDVSLNLLSFYKVECRYKQGDKDYTPWQYLGSTSANVFLTRKLTAQNESDLIEFRVKAFLNNQEEIEIGSTTKSVHLE